MIDVELDGPWLEVQSALERLADPTQAAQVIDEVVEAEAKFFASELRRGLRAQAPGGRPLPPLAESTLRVRALAGIGSTKRLIASGAMLRSVEVVQVRRGEYWAGVPSRVVKGRNLADIAEMNERGALIIQRVTQRQRGWMAANLGGAPPVGSTIRIRIPAAPFVEPTYNAIIEGARAHKRIQARTTRLVNRLLRQAGV